MRVVLATLFIFAATFWSLSKVPERMMPWALFVIWPLSFFLAFVLFDKGFLRRLFVSDAEHIQQQLKKGRARKETYDVARALSFEDTRTGCMVHFLEIGDGAMMILYGQYLYDYEPIDDEPELNQPRRFPTRTFTVVRSLKSDELLDLEIGAEVLGTQLVDEPDDYKAIAGLGIKLEDGEIVNDVTFDELEAAVTGEQTS